MSINQVNIIHRNVIRGLSPGELLKETSAHILESVHPECAILYSRVLSVTDFTNGEVVQENRNESMQPARLLTKLVELENAANFEIDETFVYEEKNGYHPRGI